MWSFDDGTTDRDRACVIDLVDNMMELSVFDDGSTIHNCSNVTFDGSAM